MTPSSESTRWLAVSRRDRAANSSFFYGAISTHIFCRPTCPGRLARRANVVFFNTQHQAVASGYRPCKRCQPCNAEWSRGREGRILAQCLRALIVTAQTKKTTPWTVEAFARDLGVSGAHLHRQFKKHYNLTPKSFGASLERGESPRPIPTSEDEDEQAGTRSAVIEPDEAEFQGELLQSEPIDNEAVRFCAEPDERDIVLEPSFHDDFGISPSSLDLPSSSFLDDLTLEAFLNLDNPQVTIN